MPVIIKNKGETLYAFIKGEIDHHTAPEIRENIDDAILLHENAKHLVIDFSDVSFMDSSGVGLVMGRYRLLHSKSKTLEVDNLSERDYKIMKMSGIERLAQIRKTESKRRLGENL